MSALDAPSMRSEPLAAKVMVFVAEQAPNSSITRSREPPGNVLAAGNDTMRAAVIVI